LPNLSRQWGVVLTLQVTIFCKLLIEGVEFVRDIFNISGVRSYLVASLVSWEFHRRYKISTLSKFSGTAYEGVEDIIYLRVEDTCVSSGGCLYL